MFFFNLGSTLRSTLCWSFLFPFNKGNDYTTIINELYTYLCLWLKIFFSILSSLLLLLSLTMSTMKASLSPDNWKVATPWVLSHLWRLHLHSASTPMYLYPIKTLSKSTLLSLSMNSTWTSTGNLRYSEVGLEYGSNKSYLGLKSFYGS